MGERPLKVQTFTDRKGSTIPCKPFVYIYKIYFVTLVTLQKSKGCYLLSQCNVQMWRFEVYADFCADTAVILESQKTMFDPQNLMAEVVNKLLLLSLIGP